MNYEPWLCLSESELLGRDIAEVNLACACELPNAEQLDIPELCRKLDGWAEIVRYAIGKAKVHRHKSKYSHLNSAQYRVMVMVTALQRDLGVTYNHAFSQGEYDANDSRNLFLHGLLSGHGGTCVTMPLLYIAIGRRLGFPLKLVKAKEHLFCRWDEPSRKFNIEATSPGFNSRPDEFYLKWPRPITPNEQQRGWYLRSLTAKEELAQFVANRGNCLTDHLQTLRAAEAYKHAYDIAPNDPAYFNHWRLTSVLHRVLADFRKARKAAPDSLATRITYPNQQPWERELIPVAIEYLNRIIRNRIAKEKHAARNHVIEQESKYV